MSLSVICWDMNGTILNEERTTETSSLKRSGSVRYKTSEISYEDEETSRLVTSFWEIAPRKDIATTLAGLSNYGCKNIVTTNAGDISEIEKVLSSVGLKDYFSGIYCVATGRLGKDYTFPLQQQGLSPKEYSRAIAIGNEYHRDCPINPLGMPLILDERPFCDSSSIDVALTVAELFGAGKGDFYNGTRNLLESKESHLKISLEENVDSQSPEFGKRVVPVIRLFKQQNV